MNKHEMIDEIREAIHNEVRDKINAVSRVEGVLSEDDIFDAVDQGLYQVIRATDDGEQS